MQRCVPVFFVEKFLKLNKTIILLIISLIIK